MMASSKKLTEEQINENLFTAIMTKIMHGNVDRVVKALQDSPELTKYAKETDKAVKKLQKQIKRANKATKKAQRNIKF